MWKHDRRMAEPEPVIVVVEDDPNIADLVDLYLRQDGYRVYQAATGERGLELVRERSPRLVVLDVGLPGIDGLEVCRQLRATSDVPIIMLTARDGEIDRVLGLEMGADDYVAKPFSPRELVARVKAILRRADGPPREAPPVIVVGDVEVDLGRREARVQGQVVPLAAREFELLAHLAEHRIGRQSGQANDVQAGCGICAKAGQLGQDGPALLAQLAALCGCARLRQGKRPGQAFDAPGHGSAGRLCVLDGGGSVLDGLVVALADRSQVGA